MPDTIITPSAVTLAQGYSLGQAVREVRQALRARRLGFATPVTGPQGDDVATWIDKVRSDLRDDASSDSDRFVSDAKIVQFVNEGLIDCNDRTHAIRSKATGVTDGTALIPLPGEFITLEALYVNGRPTQYVDDDEEWDDWAYSDAAPPRTICRIAAESLEVYPVPGNGTAWDLRMVSRPYLFTGPTDVNLTNLPRELHLRVLYYARAQAHLRLRNLAEGDRNMSLYQQGLGPGSFEHPTDAEKAKPREVQDYEIVGWLNEGGLQIAYREECLVTRRDGELVPADGRIELGEEFLRARSLRLSAVASDGSPWVEFVRDDVFDSWAYDPNAPTLPHPIGRVVYPYLEIYPAPADGTTFVLEQAVRPAIVVQLSDRFEIPVALQRKAINFAISSALLSAPVDQLDLARADRYTAAFESGMRQGNVHNREEAGPITLSLRGNVFDWDPEAAHH